MAKGLFTTTATGLALAALTGLAACTPPHPHARAPLKRLTALECPDHQGDLTLQSAAPRSCVYTGDDGATLTLQLVDLAGADPHAALSSVEQEVNAELPAALRPGSPATPAAANGKTGDWSTGEHGHDEANIDLPGLHIHSDGSGKANVDVGGVHVHADDRDGHHGDAHVIVNNPVGHEGVTVDAHDGGAQVRIQGDGHDIRYVYILDSETPGPHGYRIGGYEARGPQGGPVVVAKMFARSKDDDDIRHDASALIRKNLQG